MGIFRAGWPPSCRRLRWLEHPLERIVGQGPLAGKPACPVGAPVVPRANPIDLPSDGRYAPAALPDMRVPNLGVFGDRKQGDEASPCHPPVTFACQKRGQDERPDPCKT